MTAKEVEAKREHPILFSGPMVKAILAGTKTQTRRVVVPQPREGVGHVGPEMLDPPRLFRTWLDRRQDGKTKAEHDFNAQTWRCPFGEPGHRLWVRESFGLAWPDHAEEGWVGDPAAPEGCRPIRDEECVVEYRVDAPEDENPCGWPKATKFESADPESPRWKPSIHMPRWASRITLEVVGVRVERVQEITGGDAIAEGFLNQDVDDCAEGPIVWYQRVWDRINGGRGWWWRLNPWVWCVEFRRLPSA